MKNTIFSHKFMCGFQHFCMVLWSQTVVVNSELAELIVYIIPPEWICIVTKSYWILYFLNIKDVGVGDSYRGVSNHGG